MGGDSDYSLVLCSVKIYYCNPVTSSSLNCAAFLKTFWLFYGLNLNIVFVIVLLIVFEPSNIKKMLPGMPFHKNDVTSSQLRKMVKTILIK